MNTLTSHETARNPFQRSGKQIKCLQQRGRNRAERFGGTGVRTDRVWSKHPAELAKKPRSNVDLGNALAWIHARRGAVMSDADKATMREVEDRSWGYAECSAAHIRAIPTWLVDQLPKRRGGGYRDFLGLILSSYRSGALGLMLSYAEAMELTQIASESTWRRWSAEMEDLGFIRIVQTWREDPTGDRPRIFGELHYRIGPALEDLGGEAILEGALDRKSQRTKGARIAGIQLRKAYRERAWSRLHDLNARRAKCNDPKRSIKHDKIVTCKSKSPNISPANLPVHTPLRDFDNRNALPPPKSGGKHHTPIDGGDLKKAQPSPKALVAISSGESAPLADSRPTAQIYAEMLAKLGMRGREIERLSGIAQPNTRRSPSADQPPVGRTATTAAQTSQKFHSVVKDLASERRQPIDSRPPAPEQTPENRQQNAVRVNIGGESVPLFGPLADVLKNFFSS